MRAFRSRHAARCLALELLLVAGTAPSCADSGPDPPRAYARPAYATLAETGLYTELSTRQLAPDVQPYAPRFSLWADGSDKARWIALPDGSQIDRSDVDHWVFPIGTRFWKEFSLEGLPLETRLIERHGPGPSDYWMGSFVWRADRSDADFVERGEQNLLGTSHDAPSREQCGACHNGEPGRILGYSALQLAELGAALQDDDPTSAAFGYLHANCGHCHNPRGTAWPDTQLLLRLALAETEGELVQSGAFQSIVGRPLQYFRDDVLELRVAPGDPAQSALLARMQMRGPDVQMPPLASELVDPEGVESVRRWIAQLRPRDPEELVTDEETPPSQQQVLPNGAEQP